MNKVALAGRLEGYSKIFASDSPMAVDLMAMSKALQSMTDEKFASIINDGFEADTMVEAEDKESLTVPPTQMRKGPGPSGMTQREQQRGGTPGGSGKNYLDQLIEKAQAGKLTEQDEQKLESIAKSASEDKEPAGIFWTKEASNAVLQNLVKDVTGMDKSICCNTKRNLDKVQMPDGEKRAETPSTLKSEQTPDVSESLDTGMVKKSQGAVKKEAGSIKGPGNPDGTGPMSGTDKCPMSKEDEKKVSDKEAAETFKCPKCGSKVLKKTGYCVKCKQKVKEASDKSHEKQEGSGLKKIEEGLEVVQEAEKKEEKSAMDDTEKRLKNLEKEKKQEADKKKMEELKEKSRKQESSEQESIVVDGIQFDSPMTEVDITPEEQDQLSSLFQ